MPLYIYLPIIICIPPPICLGHSHMNGSAVGREQMEYVLIYEAFFNKAIEKEVLFFSSGNCFELLKLYTIPIYTGLFWDLRLKRRSRRRIIVSFLHPIYTICCNYWLVSSSLGFTVVDFEKKNVLGQNMYFFVKVAFPRQKNILHFAKNAVFVHFLSMSKCLNHVYAFFFPRLISIRLQL